MSQQNTDSESDKGWLEIDSPTSNTLYDVVQTPNGAYAVGESGVVLARTDDGWRVVIEDGPTTQGNNLTAADVTDDGDRIWFAGDSGALGMCDTETGRKHDYSAPKEKTSTWGAVAVTGDGDDERIHVANGSGEVLSATIDGNVLRWGEVIKPGSGSSIAALDHRDETCYAIETDGGVFRETDTGWKAIGIESDSASVFDLHAGAETLLAACNSGRLYRYDRARRGWTPLSVGEESLSGVDRLDKLTVAVGESGRIYERSPRWKWRRTASPTEGELRAVALGAPDIAVGADGTIVERRHYGNRRV